MHGLIFETSIRRINQLEKDKCFNSSYKGIIYQIIVSHSLRGRFSLLLENTNLNQ